MIKAFPKIFHIGTDYVIDIFKEEVEVTEKVDGSQFSFGRINGELYLRSKGAMLYIDNPEKMFSEGIAYIEEIQHLLPEGIIFYAEYLKKPKHNTLAYDRLPQNHLMLFGVMHISDKFEQNLDYYANLLSIECIPVFYRGIVESPEDIAKMLEKESVLGGAKIEGVVIKNYERKFLLGGQPMPVMAGKYVSEEFKEVHRGRWGKEENKKSRMEVFYESFRTEARWEKAVQHLAEKGKLENDPRDIGKLFKEVHVDIEGEEKEAIKEFLWKEFSKDLKRKSTIGMPEWYKQRLASRAFE